MIETLILNPNDRGVGGVSMLMLMNTNPNSKWTPYTLMIETPVLNIDDWGVSIIVLINCIVTNGRHWFNTPSQNNTNHNPKQNSLNPNDRRVGGETVSMLVLMNTNPNPEWTQYTLMNETLVPNPNDWGASIIVLMNCHHRPTLVQHNDTN